MQTLILIASLMLGVLPSSTTNGRVEYTAAGGTQFTFSFKTLSTSHIKVYKNSALQSTGYAVALNTNQDSSPGGTVTFTVAPVAGTVVRIERLLPVSNESVWTSFSRAKSLELDLDRSAMRDQQLQRNIDDVMSIATTAQASAASAATSSAASAASATASASSAASSAASAAAVAAGVAQGSVGGDGTLVTPTGGFAARTLANHLGDRPLNVKDFGALGDGATDDVAAIQAAIDKSRPVDGWTPIGRCVYFPKATYRVSAPLKVYSGTCLIGEGSASMIETTVGFAGAAVLLGQPASSTSLTALTQLTIRELGVAGAQTGLWALDLTPQATVTQVVVDGLTFWTAKGINACSYLQGAVIRRVLSMGSVDQVLCASGNFNLFERIDKEATTGATVDPYILVTGHVNGSSHANTFKGVLLEGTTSANKTMFRATNTIALVLEDAWFEPTSTDGYSLKMIDSKDFQIRGNLSLIGTWGKIGVERSYGRIVNLDVDGEDIAWTQGIEADSGSSVEIDQVYSRYSAGPYPIDSGANLRARAFVNRTLFTSPVTGILPVAKATNRPEQNLLKNPSFESGLYSWTGWGAPIDATYAATTSAVGPGLMAHLSTFTAAVTAITQRVVVPSAWVGRTMVLSYKIKVTGAGYTAPYVSGAGITGYADSTSRVTSSHGWQLPSITFKPQAAGNLDVGAWIKGTDGTTVVDIDEMRLAFGDEAVPAGGAYQQIELSERSVLFGSAAPTTGTWKQGDIVFNSTPTVGSPLGWRALAAGEPGSWEPMYVHTTAP